MGVLECSFANAVIPFFVIPFALLVVPEYRRWVELTSFGPSGTVIILTICLSITITKYADRLSKFSIISMANAMFFAGVDSNMKVVAGVGTFLFFEEKIYWSEVVGFSLIVISLGVMIEDKKNKLKHTIYRPLLSAKANSGTAIEDTTADTATEIDRYSGGLSLLTGGSESGSYSAVPSDDSEKGLQSHYN
jgi:hypothetical protein